MTTHVLQTLPPLAVGAQEPAAIDPTLDLCTRYPLQLGGPRQSRIRSLPNTSTHGQHWESNPRPSDLEPNSLSTRPHASTTKNALVVFIANLLCSLLSSVRYEKNSLVL